MSIQREQAKLKKVNLTVTYVNLILPSAGDETNWDKEMFSPIIKSDIGRLQQVILNLQSNALKFTSKGSVEIIVEITSTDLNGEFDLNNLYLKISVIDTGLGIK